MQTFIRKVINNLFLFLFSFNFNAQITFFRDIFNGGICVTGTATWDANGIINLPYFVEPLSTVKKIFLITYANSPDNQNQEAENFDAIINNSYFPQNFIDNF